MAKVKYDVSDVDAADAVGRIFQEPQPGLYNARVREVEHGFSKGDDGKPDKSRARLQVIYEILDEGDFKGSRLYDYVSFSEAAKWRLDQFLQAMGESSEDRRKGEFDTDDFVGMPVKLKVKPDTNQDGTYRARVGTVMMAEDRDVNSSLEDLEDAEDVTEDTDEIEDEYATTDADAGYSEEDLDAMSIKELSAILKELDVESPKGKQPKIDAILANQGGGSDDEEQDISLDLDALAEQADEDEDEDAMSTLADVCAKHDLDDADYGTWAEAVEAIREAQGGVDLSGLSVAQLREKAEELELETTGKKVDLVARIQAELEGDPF